jgi:hypothetical protein
MDVHGEYTASSCSARARRIWHRSVRVPFAELSVDALADAGRASRRWEADHHDGELVIVVTTCKRADHLAAAADREGERPRIGGGGG